jgi:hypothetical protein
MIFVSCEEESVYTADEKFVLQAYLYANEPVWDVSLRKTVPLTVTDSVGEPINEASVTLLKDGESYALTLYGDSGYYYYPESDLVINEGEVWQIEATYNGQTATAESVVPTAPKGVTISNEVIDLPEISFGGQNGPPDFASLQAFREALEGFEQTIVWDNPNNELFFVVIESLSADQEPIFNNNDGFGGGPGGGRFGFRRVSAPTRDNYYEINLGELTYWGGYVAKVYKVNQEYADLYENLTQDSRDLNEPPTNVNNALGIFSTFNATNVYFEVRKQ